MRATRSWNSSQLKGAWCLLPPSVRGFASHAASPARSYKYCELVGKKWVEKASGKATGEICGPNNAGTVYAKHLVYADLNTARFADSHTLLRHNTDSKQV